MRGRSTWRSSLRRPVAIRGRFRKLEANLNRPRRRAEVTAGGCIIAIGFSPFDASAKPELAYGKDERVMTTVEFEQRREGLSLPAKPRVAILHCVGSRDEQVGRPYCSRVCCINALRIAEAVKQKYDGSYVECFYMDVRAHPRGGEEFFEDTQEKGTLFTRGNVAGIVPGRKGCWCAVRGHATRRCRSKGNSTSQCSPSACRRLRTARPSRRS